jgi:hypothetical protein
VKTLSVLLAGTILTACAPQASLVQSTESQLLKDWALSRCLAKAGPDSELGKDASRSAAALLERGSAQIETYEKLETLAQKFLSRPYSGSVAGAYNTLKCIEFYHSDELDRGVNGAK